MQYDSYSDSARILLSLVAVCCLVLYAAWSETLPALAEEERNRQRQHTASNTVKARLRALSMSTAIVCNAKHRGGGGGGQRYSSSI